MLSLGLMMVLGFAFEECATQVVRGSVRGMCGNCGAIPEARIKVGICVSSRVSVRVGVVSAVG